MKIWIVSYYDDSGSAPEVYTSQTEAEDAAWEWCRHYWEEEHKFSDPIPEFWADAYDQLLERATAWGDSIYVSEQEVKPQELKIRPIYWSKNLQVLASEYDIIGPIFGGRMRIESRDNINFNWYIDEKLMASGSFVEITKRARVEHERLMRSQIVE